MAEGVTTPTNGEATPISAGVGSFSSFGSDVELDPEMVSRVQAEQNLNLGTDLEVSRSIFDRSDELTLTASSSSSRAKLGSRGPQSEFWTDRPDQPVQIRYGPDGPRAEAAEHIIEVFDRIVTGYGEHIALAVKRAGEWKTWTYKKYYDESVCVAKGMIELGLEPHHSVCILGFNAPEWNISNMATIMASGLVVGIYLTNSAETCYTIASGCRANVIIVENESQLQKILQVRHRLPELKAVVQYSKGMSETDEGVYSWQQLLNLGMRTSDAKLKERLAMLRADKCSTIIYTSGTTGLSKGVMLSHDNLMWVARRVMGEVSYTVGEEHVISYLPLSHVAPQLLDIYVSLYMAGTCWFAQPDALKGSLLQTMKEVHPTIFLGVPRVWEKIAESMQTVARNTKGLKAKVASWAKGVGLRANFNKQTGRPGSPFGYSIAKHLFFKKVRLALGLDRCHFPMTAAAPTNQDTITYFMSVNIPLHEIYGMSETAGPTTATTVDRIRFCSSGRAVKGAELKIDDPDEDGVGEVLVRGRHVFMGYLGLPEKTREVLTEDGWFRSGDIGYITEEQYLYITGRKKELIILASGEKIPPVPIEHLIKQELPLVSNAMLIGDNQKFLCCLLTLKVVTDDTTGLPTNQLSEVAVAASQRVGSPALTVSDVLERGGDHKVLKMIQKGVDTVNKKAPSKVHKIAKWSILEQDFSVAGGELTPTLKLKRSVIMTKYADSIDSFYM